MSDLNKILEALHSKLAQDLLKRVESGEATASELNVIRQFLKDNNIDAVPAEGSPMGNLVAGLPFDQNEEVH